MLGAASEAGIDFRVTRGVLEESERHINRSLACSRRTGLEWVGQVPYLFAFYIESGFPAADFGAWAQRFRGDFSPEDDIGDFLKENHGVSVVSLEEEVENAPNELRMAVRETWIEIHERRRSTHEDHSDTLATQRLAEHDVENYLGVLQRRRGEQRAPFGYTSWWLSLDRSAFQVAKDVADRLGKQQPPSPVLSADFLVESISFGPSRMRVSKSADARLPIMVDLGVTDALSPELLSEAELVREKATGLPESVIRRQVRDFLDKARGRPGRITTGGLPSPSEY